MAGIQADGGGLVLHALLDAPVTVMSPDCFLGVRPPAHANNPGAPHVVGCLGCDLGQGECKNELTAALAGGPLSVPKDFCYSLYIRVAGCFVWWVARR